MADKYRIATSILIGFTDISNLTIGSVFCPFHLNINTKAGRLYSDSDGIERLYCHSCRRQFTSADYITRILGVEDLKSYLLERFTEEDINKAYNLAMSKRKQEDFTVPEFLDAEDFFKQLYLGEYYLGS